MSSLLKILCSAFAVVVIGIFAASCGSGNAQYRVVNAIANTTQEFDPNGFAIYMNGGSIWTSVCFPCSEPSSNNKYQSVSGGSDTLEVFRNSDAGQTGAQPLVSSSLSLGGGTQYTVVLAGNSTATGATYPLAEQLITDNNPIPTSGDAGIRVIDASLNLPSVDIYVLPTGTACSPCPSAGKIASGLQYPQSAGTGNISSGYQNVGVPTNPTVVVWVTGAGNASDPIFNHSYTLTAGNNYTLVLADSSGGTSPPQFVFLTP